FGRTGHASPGGAWGNVAARPGGGGNLRAPPAVAATPTDPGASSRTAFYERDRAVIAYARRSDEGWALVAQQDYDEAYAPLREANRNAMILLAGSVIFVGIVASVLGSRLTRPIRNLTNIADEISRGELTAEIAEVRRSDEIGGLAPALDPPQGRAGTAMKRLGLDQRSPAGGSARHPAPTRS